MMPFTGTFISSLTQVAAAQWQQLFPADHPFTRYEFLIALEQAGCTTAHSGWLPRHLLINQQDTLVAAIPCYIKSHSYGEYIFDWSWAQAYEQNGLKYYPKIVCAIPFTPATGPRLGILPEYQHRSVEIIDCVTTLLDQFAEQIDASNWQCLFSQSDLSQQLNRAGWLSRIDVQFHWFNRNYRDFDDFVATFTARKRKNVLKERRQIIQAGLTIRVIEGIDIDPPMWQRFFMFYQMTYLKRSGHSGYLNQQWFSTLGKTMPQCIVMIVAQNNVQSSAENNGEMVAASLFFKSSNTLFGRYWGAIESHQFLHFECCYYQGIEYCIKNGLERFDAGAQGEHKLGRGFEPVLTHANYQIRDPRFSHAIADFLEQEKAHIENYRHNARELLPYKSTDGK